ncbi:MAG: FAD:protein FMN transferase [Defluviitaleaceae bacterium]|nr:FAD:protein FMN transferase [Defluviitaleaceae bacterium]MCL2837226.1 FAD:protein FMN transferase [Defluviitaleaceae bacterium]
MTVISVNALMMDTFVSISIYNPRDGDDGILEETLDFIRGLEQLLSRTAAGSDIRRVNEAAGGEPVAIAAETYEIIKIALDSYELTGGLFDITIGAVSGLWDFTHGSEPPQCADVLIALEFVGLDTIELRNSMIIKKYGGTQLDLGGIAKGFIADKAHDFLQKKGVKSAVIDTGGDIRLLGARPETGIWNVAVEDPFGQSERIGILGLTGGAVATSGSYQRGFFYDGRLYHHILDPATGYPRETDLISVSVTAETATFAEILVTTAFMMGLSDGMQFIEELNKGPDDIGAVFVTADGMVLYCGSLTLD